jgi:hypothetical protein
MSWPYRMVRPNLRVAFTTWDGRHGTSLRHHGVTLKALKRACTLLQRAGQQIGSRTQCYNRFYWTWAGIVVSFMSTCHKPCPP